MTIATLYKANGEIQPIWEADYTIERPGIEHGAPQPQLTIDHIASLIGTSPNSVLFCESQDGQRFAYASGSYTKPLNAFAAAHSVLQLHGDVVEIPYFNSIDID